MENTFSKKGFTLIELLIVIAIIAILALGLFIALNPAQRFADARDATRNTHAVTIADAIKLNEVDAKGALIESLNADAGLVDDAVYMIGTEADANCEAADLVDLTCPDAPAALNGNCVDLTELVTEGHIGQIPVSPTNQTGAWDAGHTGYVLQKSAQGAFTITACESENSDPISVVR